MRWPGVTPAGSICHEPMISTDYYPTLLEAVGLPPRPAQHRDGVSIVPLLRGTPMPQRPIFWHYPHYSNQGGGPGGAIRLGDFKLIESYEDDHVELYNLKEDLSEKSDLASKLPDKAKELRQKLHEWRQSVAAQMPTPNPDYAPPAKPGSKKNKKRLRALSLLRNCQQA